MRNKSLFSKTFTLIFYTCLWKTLCQISCFLFMFSPLLMCYYYHFPTKNCVMKKMDLNSLYSIGTKLSWSWFSDIPTYLLGEDFKEWAYSASASFWTTHSHSIRNNFKKHIGKSSYDYYNYSLHNLWIFFAFYITFKKCMNDNKLHFILIYIISSVL